MKEPDVYVSLECIDVAEWRIFHARDRTAVVHELPNVVASLSNDVKPFLRDGSQFTCLVFHPRIDGRIPPDPAGEPKVHSIHGANAGPDFSQRRTTRFHHMIAPVTNSAGGTSPISAQVALVVELQSAPQPGMPRPPSRPKCR